MGYGTYEELGDRTKLEIGSKFGLKLEIWGSAHRGGVGGGSLPQVVSVERKKNPG